MYRLFLLISCLLLLTGCHPRSCLLEPEICYTPQPKQFGLNPSPFQPLNEEEENQEWGKELKIGIFFGRELDLYRAITAFKRSLILMPAGNCERSLQVQYYIIQAYYLGSKFEEAISFFETSGMPEVPSSFPAFRELVIILYDAYRQVGQCEKAEAILRLIEKGDPETAVDLKIYSSVINGDLSAAEAFSCDTKHDEELRGFAWNYCCCAKSVRKAQTLNAVFPGAGYYYVGQKKSAVTSFCINVFTTAAAYYFFNNGNWGAGCIAASLEMGWYFGGINGAGLAAKEYNQRIYEDRGKDFLVGRKLFPVLMLETSF